jgi:DNA-binding CsgD family transcriptional regulator
VTDRTLRELERLAAERQPPDVLYESLLALLEREGLHYDGACWHLTDPVTGMLTRMGVIGELPGDFHTALHFELFEEDVAKLDEVGSRKVPVASLVHETGGKPERSARYREIIRPDGHADELRAVFADPFGRWGSLNIFREREPFDARDREALAHVVPLFAQALRIAATIGDARAVAAPVPGVLVLDREERLESADARARSLLGEPDQAPLELPGAVYVAAARVRHDAAPVRGRMRTGTGEWLLLDATGLDRDRIAIVVQPAPATTLVDVRLRTAGLTEREREVAAGVLRGDSTAQIAAALFLSPWTVQDHLKSIFEKTGVRSRSELVQQVALGGVEAG